MTKLTPHLYNFTLSTIYLAYSDCYVSKMCVFVCNIYFQALVQDFISKSTKFMCTQFHSKHIIMSCHQYGNPCPSLATPPYRSSLLAGPWGYISYTHRAAVCRFELVSLLLLGHVRGFIEHHLCARPCFSRSVLHVWFVSLFFFSQWVVGGCIAVALRGIGMIWLC